MRPAAVFDLDGTLLVGTSAERLLVPYLLRRGVIGPRQLLRAAARASATPVLGVTRALRRNKQYLAGVERAAVVDLMPDFLARCLDPRWRTCLLRRTEALRAEGRPLYLLTGAPDFIADVVRRHLGFAGAVGTALEVRQGRYTGRLAGPHLFSEGKVAALARLARAHTLDLPRSVGFADHTSDVAFLTCFGHPVAVAPDGGLRRHAHRRGWEILSCR